MTAAASDVEVVRHHGQWFVPEQAGFAPILERASRAKAVLIGEASHGTHEFYAVRAALTKALIAQQHFNLVAVEADWPDAYRANRWVRHLSDEPDVSSALGDFHRFPRWMWRNEEVATFLSWLHDFNRDREARTRVGFYGLDLYSLHASIDAVLRYLATVDPDAAQRARHRYACFEDFGQNSQAYGYAATLGLTESCEREVLDQLIDLRRRAAHYMSRDGLVAADDFFFAEQNARLVRNAEQYYRSMFRSRDESWNLRDTHMMETLEALLDHASQVSGAPARAVVWAHNSHLGDARATQMGSQGELNLGQLARERFGEGCYSIGFTTHTGTVTAATDWDEPAQRRRVRPSLAGSYERLFHDTGLERFLLLLDDPEVANALRRPRLERAIGVIYRPETERWSHYFDARLAEQFDALIHIDETRALTPMETWSLDEADVPETYPSAL